MTHFLFLEKGAQSRDGARREIDRRDSGPTLVRRPSGPVDAAASPTHLYLVLPTSEGYRLLRASLEELALLPGQPAQGGDEDELELVERILGRMGAAIAPLGPPRGRPGREAAESIERERFGEIEIDVAARVVRRAGRLVALAPLEFDLLLALVRRRGAAASRRDLLREVWGTTRSVSVRTVDTHVSNVRRKIEPAPRSPRHILTVKKVGYRFQR